jgi:hypothetical protein
MRKIAIALFLIADVGFRANAQQGQWNIPREAYSHWNPPPGPMVIEPPPPPITTIEQADAEVHRQWSAAVKAQCEFYRYHCAEAPR